MARYDIIEKIKVKITEGMEKELIEFELMDSGYNIEEINQAFKEFEENTNSYTTDPNIVKNYKKEYFSDKRLKYGIIASMIGLVLGGIFYVFGAIEEYKGKTNDRIRKNDLEEIKIALESYYMENYIYPNSLEEISEQSFTPYALPPKYSDPVTLEPYKYIPINEGMGYKLCANLEMPKNEEICINSGI